MKNPFYNHLFVGVDQAACLVVPPHDYYLLNAVTADASVPDDDTPDGVKDADWKNCRFISCDVSGLVKVDYWDDHDRVSTEVMRLNQGELRPLRNVQKLYNLTAAQTTGTAGSYDSTGTLRTPAIKLYR